MLVQCAVDNKKIIDPDQPQFDTTDPSELFFKNVRALYYDKEENQAGKLEIFRIKRNAASVDSTALNVVIVLNWRLDQAYVLIESDGLLAGERVVTLVWEDEQEGDRGSAAFDLNDKNSQFTLASTIYGYILKRYNLYYLENGKKRPLLASKEAREAFRITMFDFYNLVELL